LLIGRSFGATVTPDATSAICSAHLDCVASGQLVYW